MTKAADFQASLARSVPEGGALQGASPAPYFPHTLHMSPHIAAVSSTVRPAAPSSHTASPLPGDQLQHANLSTVERGFMPGSAQSDAGPSSTLAADLEHVPEASPSFGHAAQQKHDSSGWRDRTAAASHEAEEQQQQQHMQGSNIMMQSHQPQSQQVQQAQPQDAEALLSALQASAANPVTAASFDAAHAAAAAPLTSGKDAAQEALHHPSAHFSDSQEHSQAEETAEAAAKPRSRRMTRSATRAPSAASSDGSRQSSTLSRASTARGHRAQQQASTVSQLSAILEAPECTSAEAASPRRPDALQLPPHDQPGNAGDFAAQLPDYGAAAVSVPSHRTLPDNAVDHTDDALHLLHQSGRQPSQSGSLAVAALANPLAAHDVPRSAAVVDLSQGLASDSLQASTPAGLAAEGHECSVPHQGQQPDTALTRDGVQAQSAAARQAADTAQQTLQEGTGTAASPALVQQPLAQGTGTIASAALNLQPLQQGIKPPACSDPVPPCLPERPAAPSQQPEGQFQGKKGSKSKRPPKHKQPSEPALPDAVDAEPNALTESAGGATHSDAVCDQASTADGALMAAEPAKQVKSSPVVKCAQIELLLEIVTDVSATSRLCISRWSCPVRVLVSSMHACALPAACCT